MYCLIYEYLQKQLFNAKIKKYEFYTYKLYPIITSIPMKQYNRWRYEMFCQNELNVAYKYIPVHSFHVYRIL